MSEQAASCTFTDKTVQPRARAHETLNEIDPLQLARMWGAVFEEARTPEGFAKVTVDEETRTIVWPGDADLAPDTLYERVRTGIWPDQNVAA